MRVEQENKALKALGSTAGVSLNMFPPASNVDDSFCQFLECSIVEQDSVMLSSLPIDGCNFAFTDPALEDNPLSTHRQGSWR